jgi:urease accessory protein
MYGVTSPSEVLGGSPPRLAAVPTALRAAGHIVCRFAARDGRTHLADLSESGGYRVKFPRGEGLEAVVINTGGGMAGGDRLAISLSLEADAEAVLTTQSAEKVYRADDAPSAVAVNATCAAGARLSWLPQETILFSGARLIRRMGVDMDASATLTLAETVVFGRLAMGEVPGPGLLDDRWTIRRDGRLVFAEAVKLDGPLAALLDRPALGGGARAVSNVVHVAPQAEALLESVRTALADARSDAGASAWNGMLVVRMAAEDPSALRRDMASVLSVIESRALPRVWQC